MQSALVHVSSTRVKRFVLWMFALLDFSRRSKRFHQSLRNFTSLETISPVDENNSTSFSQYAKMLSLFSMIHFCLFKFFFFLCNQFVNIVHDLRCAITDSQKMIFVPEDLRLRIFQDGHQLLGDIIIVHPSPV